VIGHDYGNRLEWFDELWLRDANTQMGLDVLWQRYKDHRGGWEFFGDASGRSRNTAAAVTDYVLIENDARFRAAGRTVHYPKSNPPVVDRFAACNALFLNASGDRRMFVDPSCKRLIADLESRYRKPGERLPEDSGDLGHITDAMGYVVHWKYPIRLQTNAKKRVIITQG
jgi:hypothetical protein